MSGRFIGKVAIVTGGASGIGLSAALMLAAEGAAVAINDVSGAATADARSQIATLGGKVLALAGDASDPDYSRAAVREVVQAWGRVDVLVNSAGIFYLGEAAAIADDHWRRVMAVNLDGAFFWSRAVAASMIDQRGGAIVNVASVSGLVANPNSAPYVASKHGLVGLTKALAVEWGPLGIRVNAICPGLTETAMVKNAWADRPAAYADRLARIPTGHAALPEDQAKAILYLASSDASAVNGLIMNIDGGTVALSSAYSVTQPTRK